MRGVVDEIVRDGNLAVRRLRDDPAEYRLLAEWLNRPHVKEWWDPDEPPMTERGAASKYGPRSDRSPPITACIIKLAGRPIGYVQFYRSDSWPDEAGEIELPPIEDAFGLDIFIGEPELVGVGLGSRAVDLVCRHLFEERGAAAVMLATEVINRRAQRAYERAGFRKVTQFLDTDTRDGERVRSWLMIREATRRPTTGSRHERRYGDL